MTIEFVGEFAKPIFTAKDPQSGVTCELYSEDRNSGYVKFSDQPDIVPIPMDFKKYCKANGAANWAAGQEFKFVCFDMLRHHLNGGNNGKN